MRAVPRRALLLAALPPSVTRGADQGTPSRLHRIGVLGTDAGDADGSLFQAFLAELKRRGRIEGRDFVLLRRYAAAGRADTLPALAAELVAAPVDVIYAVQGSASAVAAVQATRSIPVVFFSSADPVGLGLVRSLNRPGGNATGGMPLGYESASKGLEILAEAVRGLRRCVFFVPPAERVLPGNAGLEPRLRATAHRLGVGMAFVEAATGDDLIARLPALRQDGVDAAMVFDFSAYPQEPIAAACIAHRLPTYGSAWAGFLMHIEQDREALARTAARHVDRVLAGASPATLPVEQLTMHQLVLNLRTARALKLRVPAAVVARAHQVIE